MYFEYLPDINTEFYRFDSQNEQSTDVLANVLKHKGCSSTYQAWEPRVIQREGFIGRRFNTWNDVSQALGEAWENGLKIYESMMNELRDEKLPQPKAIKRQRRWSEDRGDELNIDRLLRGQAYLEDSYRETRPGPVSVTIITDISTSAFVNHDKILWRGAAAVLLTELLERAGYRVELWAATHCLRAFHNGRSFGAAVRYKCAGDPLDVSTLINGVSGWCYRTMFFGTYCVSNSPPVTGLGVVTGFDRIVPYISQDKNVLVCKEVWNKTAAIQWVRTQLAGVFQVQ